MKEVDIEPQLIEMIETMELIYLKNKQWMSQKHNTLYKMLEKECNKILKNKDKEKFRVELTQTGALDILNTKKDKFVFNMDPFIYGDKKAETIKEKKIKKVVFDGTQLGTQITSTIRMHKPKKAVIIEKDKQIFRCSMYVTDYEELDKISKLEFFVEDNSYEYGKKDLIVTLDDL